MKLLLTFIVLLYARILSAQGGTEIFLLNLKWNNETASVVGEPLNCSNSKGYDSQPFFEDNNNFLFTSMRNDKTADIYRYKIDSKETISVSQHPDAEYSPKRGYKKNKISVVKGAEQNITMFNLDGSNPEVIAKHKDSIGYYAYFYNGFLCFILSKPPTLQYINEKGIASILDTLPGRNLYKYKGGVFYEKELGDENFVIKYMSSSKKTSTVINLPNKVQDFYADAKGMLYCINNNVLLRYNPTSKNNTWLKVLDFSKMNLQSITRFALSPDKTKLLLVAKED